MSLKNNIKYFIKMKVSKFFNLILLLSSLNIVFNKRWGSSDLKITKGSLNLNKKTNLKKTQASSNSSFTPISIGFDFTTLEKPESMDDTIF